MVIYYRFDSKLNTPMPNKIVVNGDSFTQEAFLPYDARWSTIIGCHKNLAHGGGSNDRIFYTTINYLNSNDADCLIIGWTEPSRTMFTTREGTNVVVNVGTGFDEQTSQSREDMRKFYYLKMYNPYINFVWSLNQMLHLQEYCHLKKIKLLYWNALLPSISDKEIDEICSHAYIDKSDKHIEKAGFEHTKAHVNDLLSRLDKEIWVKEFWYSIGQHNMGLPKLDDGHFDVEGSQAWAKLIEQYL